MDWAIRSAREESVWGEVNAVILWPGADRRGATGLAKPPRRASRKADLLARGTMRGREAEENSLLMIGLAAAFVDHPRGEGDTTPAPECPGGGINRGVNGPRDSEAGGPRFREAGWAEKGREEDSTSKG